MLSHPSGRNIRYYPAIGGEWEEDDDGSILEKDASNSGPSHRFHPKILTFASEMYEPVSDGDLPSAGDDFDEESSGYKGGQVYAGSEREPWVERKANEKAEGVSKSVDKKQVSKKAPEMIDVDLEDCQLQPNPNQPHPNDCVILDLGRFLFSQTQPTIIHFHLYIHIHLLEKLSRRILIVIALPLGPHGRSILCEFPSSLITLRDNQTNRNHRSSLMFLSSTHCLPLDRHYCIIVLHSHPNRL